MNAALTARFWLRRIGEVEATGQAWATGSVGPQPTFVGGNEKATIEDAKKAPGQGVADGVTGSGAASGGVAVAINQAREQLTPYSSARGWIEKVVVALIIAGAVLAVGGFAYRWYANYQKAKLDDALDPDPVAA